MSACGRFLSFAMAAGLSIGTAVQAQMIDNNQAPNVAKAGINKSLQDEIGAGRGNVTTPGSSMCVIARDPFRSVRRGRQLFQRKFTQAQGQGPNENDGVGDINTDKAIGAGLSDSCALCHGRPRGSAGVGGNVVTRPDSRDAPHLFGLGLREMLADEITTDLRNTRSLALIRAAQMRRAVTLPLRSKGINYGSITAQPDGSVDTSQVSGVDADLRVKPFFAEGSEFSIRRFIVGALHNEMGLEASGDPDNELGWKETVRMNPGGVTTVIMQFNLPNLPTAAMRNAVSPRTGGKEYVWHCHILEHEEHDMMRPLVVE
ncbi:MAG TPA: multicopper oxidase domain-containing protein [Terriglobales bacterium]|nr:multicopper oxidase domain-containing protein [Terriglobales bacterium]